jgi:rRNA-processing protein EBP2
MAKGKGAVAQRRRRNEDDDDMLENDQDIEELKKLVEEARTNRPKDIKKKMKKLAKGKKLEDDEDEERLGVHEDDDEEASDEERVLRELKAESSRNGEEDGEDENDVQNSKTSKSHSFVNDSTTLKQIAAELALSDFAESLQLTDDVINPEKVNPEDDKIREALFQDCAIRSVKAARAKLDEMKIPHRRPTDFMAEMIKSDDHMARVKRRLLFEQQKMKVVDARKAAQRNKKRGKEIKKQKEQEKASKKRQAAEIATSYREKDDLDETRPSKKTRIGGGGHGGKGKGKGAPKQGGGGGAKKRLGKNKRNSSRGNRK